MELSLGRLARRIPVLEPNAKNDTRLSTDTIPILWYFGLAGAGAARKPFQTGSCGSDANHSRVWLNALTFVPNEYGHGLCREF